MSAVGGAAAVPAARSAPPGLGAVGVPADGRRSRTSGLGDGLAMAVTAGSAALIGMVSWIVVARYLPPAEVGRAAAFVSGFLLVAGCTEINLGVGLLRWLPRAGARSTAVVVRCLIAVTVLTALVAGAYLLLPGSRIVLDAAPGSPDSPALAVTCFVLACVAWAVFQQQDFALVGLGRPWWAPARIGLFAVSRAVVLVAGTLSAVAVVWSWLAPVFVCVLVTAAATLWWSRRPRGTALDGRTGLPDRREVLGFLGFTYVGHIGLSLLFYLVPLIVTARYGPALGAPFFIIWQAVVVVDVVAHYFVASLAAAVAREPERAAHHGRATRNRLLLLVLPALVVGIPLAGPVLSLFGPAYAAHATVLQVMLVGTAFRIWVVHRLGEYQAHGRGLRYAVVSVTNTAAVVALAAVIPVGSMTVGSMTVGFTTREDPLMPLVLGYVLIQLVVAAATTLSDRATLPARRPVRSRNVRTGKVSVGVPPWRSVPEPAPEAAPDAPVPAVSVCVPVYKGEDHLAATIESVLAQTFTDFELVVLDNCSPDRSGEIASSYDDPRIRIERNLEVLPVTDNWNTAVRHARAPLVKLLCDDDLIHPRCLELQVGAFREDPKLAVVASRQHLVDGAGRVISPGRFLRGLLGPRTRSAVIRRVVRSGINPIGAMCGVTFRRDAFAATSGFSVERLFLTDLDVVVQLTRQGGFRGQRESLAAYRIVSTSMLAGAGRAEYLMQKSYQRELRRVPGARVRPLDVVIGAFAAPLGRLRRVLVFAVAARLGREATT